MTRGPPAACAFATILAALLSAGPAPAQEIRFFTTTRGALAGGAAYQVTFGVEVDPAFFAPPFGARKFKGQMPD